MLLRTASGCICLGKPGLSSKIRLQTEMLVTQWRLVRQPLLRCPPPPSSEPLETVYRFVDRPRCISVSGLLAPTERFARSPIAFSASCSRRRNRIRGSASTDRRFRDSDSVGGPDPEARFLSGSRWFVDAGKRLGFFLIKSKLLPSTGRRLSGTGGS